MFRLQRTVLWGQADEVQCWWQQWVGSRVHTLSTEAQSAEATHLLAHLMAA